MSWADIVNGIYESLGGLMVLLSCYRLYKDKQVKGVSIVATFFFTSWGFWNLYYYPSLNQWMSFAGGIIIAVSNTLWVSLAIYYTRRARLKERGITLANK